MLKLDNDNDDGIQTTIRLPLYVENSISLIEKNRELLR
jgi:hypothetical protein